MVVTLAEMKSYLRVDVDEDDELITQLIIAAEDRCRGISRNDIFDSDPTAKIAVMYTVAYLYENREEADNTVLNLTLRSMLFKRRKPIF